MVEKSSYENLNVIKITLSNKSGNSENLKKIITTVRKFFNLCAHSWQGFAEVVLQVVLLTVLWFKWSVKKYCVVKVLLATWQIFLHENNFNYKSFRFSHKFTFIHFSASWCSGHEKYFCSLFIATRPLFRNHTEFNRTL